MNANSEFSLQKHKQINIILINIIILSMHKTFMPRNRSAKLMHRTILPINVIVIAIGSIMISINRIIIFISTQLLTI